MEIKRRVMSFWVAFFLAACARLPPVASPSPAPTNSFTKNYAQLELGNVESLRSIRTLTTEGLSGKVVEVGYIPRRNRVLAVYSDSGSVLGWSPDTGDVVSVFDLGIVSTKALSFSSSGEILMGATEHIYKPDVYNRTIEYVNGVAIWNMNTGKMETCITFPCQANDSRENGFIDTAIDTSGQWVSTYTETTVGLSDLSGKTPGRTTVVVDLDSPNRWNIGTVALDSAHSRYAVVFQEGGIWLSKQNFETPYRTLAAGTKGDGKAVAVAQFDRAGQMLAVVRDNHLSVWDTESGELLFERALRPVITMKFDQESNLLFVVTDNQIAIWDLDDQSEITNYDAPGIASLEVSDDNRLLIWGDSDGTVHLWGVSSK